MTPADANPDAEPTPREARASLAAGHLAFGWWLLLVFIVLGGVLEGLHALKVGYYLDVSNETRRLMWRLSHAHGTLLALVHIAFALSLPKLAPERLAPLRLASRCLYGGAITLPAGFFLGGLFVYGGDPGLGVVLAPVGALLLIVGVALVARATR